MDILKEAWSGKISEVVVGATEKEGGTRRRGENARKDNNKD